MRSPNVNISREANQALKDEKKRREDKDPEVIVFKRDLVNEAVVAAYGK